MKSSLFLLQKILIPFHFYFGRRSIPFPCFLEKLFSHNRKNRKAPAKCCFVLLILQQLILDNYSRLYFAFLPFLICSHNKHRNYERITLLYPNNAFLLFSNVLRNHEPHENRRILAYFVKKIHEITLPYRQVFVHKHPYQFPIALHYTLQQSLLLFH